MNASLKPGTEAYDLYWARVREERIKAAAADMVEILQSLDALWRETWPNGPESMADSFTRMPPDERSLWVDLRAVLKKAGAL